MGTYTTTGDLRKLFKKIDTAGLNDTDLEFYVSMSEAEINGYLAQQYSLPFAVVPPIVRSIAAEYSLLKVLDRFFTGETENTNSWRDTRKKELTDMLKGIVSGEIILTDSTGAEIGMRSASQDITSNIGTYLPTFGHGNPEREYLDSDRKQDEEDERK